MLGIDIQYFETLNQGCIIMLASVNAMISSDASFLYVSMIVESSVGPRMAVPFGEKCSLAFCSLIHFPSGIFPCVPPPTLSFHKTLFVVPYGVAPLTASSAAFSDGGRSVLSCSEFMSCSVEAHSWRQDQTTPTRQQVRGPRFGAASAGRPP